jgi:hypothetical protein
MGVELLLFDSTWKAICEDDWQWEGGMIPGIRACGIRYNLIL